VQAVPEDEDGDLPADPVPEVVDDRTVTLSFTALKAFLLKNELLAGDFDGSPEDLAQVVADC